MGKRTYLAVLLSLFLSTATVHADGGHEAFVNSLGFAVASGDKNIQLSPGFNYGILPWLSAGINVTFHSSSYILTKITRFTLLAGPTINIPGPVENSYFFTLGFALKTGSATQDTVDLNTAATATTSGVVTSQQGAAVNDPNGAGFGLFLGKRFAIAGKLSYRPSVGVMSTGSVQFIINAFSASYAF